MECQVLTICGGYQFLGTKYITPDGTELEGLGILDFYTKSKTDGFNRGYRN